jgi:glutamate/tyrosine decarboxylase-like PLP-dependent enzyme/tetratricopeptide (TPR) repeat protein
MPQPDENETWHETPSPTVAGLQTLDPADWQSFRKQAHAMLDDILDFIQYIRQRPVWQPIPDEVRKHFRGPLPAVPTRLEEVHREFMDFVLPFAAGNVHPGFMGWVHGGGTPVGIVAEMLAAGLNANLGGRDQVPVEVERQIARWMQSLFGFPETAAGLFVTGTSMANFIAVVIARDAALGHEARHRGLTAESKRLTAYASAAVHGCIGKALDLCGLGSDAVRLIATGDRGRMDLTALQEAIGNDRAAGFHPFLVVGTAGTVDTGAIDDLAGLADCAAREQLWFHVDGAYGALAMFAPSLAPKLRGIERADSLAFDFHKWGQVPYDAGFVLVRDGALQRQAFAASNAYLRRETRGLAAGSPWPCDQGPDLSRGFRALKTWFTLKVYGGDAIGAAIARTCALARYLEDRIAHTPELELLAPVELNVVCFRYRAKDSDRVNAQIVVELQESGSVAPSSTMVNGRVAIRAAIVNHRTGPGEIDTLIEKTVALGRRSTPARATAALAGDPGKPERSNAPASVNVPSVPRLKWEAELREVERRLAGNPDSVDLRFRRGFWLSQLQRLEEARSDYLKVLAGEPRHLGALNNLGSVLLAMGNIGEARGAFQEAILCYGDDPISRVNLGNLILREIEYMEVRQRSREALQLKHEAREHYEHALRVNPGYEQAHEGLSYLLGDLGDKPKAAWHRREAFRRRSIIAKPYRGKAAPVPVLMLVSTTGGNVLLQQFLREDVFQTHLVLPEFYDLDAPLPAHQLVVNAIGDAELAPEALAAAQSLLTLTRAPVINRPVAVLATGRSANARRLAGLPGVVAATTATLPREQLSATDAATTLAQHGLTFPLLLRAPGFHTGMNFLRVEDLAGLPAALAELAGEKLTVMQYLDARGPDGKSRKYRVMMIDGELYPLHLAVSGNWKIHYFSAEMAGGPEYRAEEAAFLEDMPGVLGRLAMRGLEQIQAMLGLDYAGIDFGLNSNGQVLLFEANAAMAVNPPAPGECCAYRQPAYQRTCAAIHKLLLERAARGLPAMNLAAGVEFTAPTPLAG